MFLMCYRNWDEVRLVDSGRRGEESGDGGTVGGGWPECEGGEVGV